MGFDFMFHIFPIFFFVIFTLMLVMFAVTAVRGLGQWSKNNRSPVLTVEAVVVAKRADVSRHIHSAGPEAAPVHSSHTTYYAAFQVESGDRMELCLPAAEYGLLAEGDRGRLTFQGTRYQGFSRL